MVSFSPWYVWVCVAVLAAAAVYAGYAGYRLQQRFAVSEDLVRQAQPYTQRPQQSRARILVAGDSTAVGVGAASSSETVAGHLGTAMPDVAIENTARSGARIADTTAQLSDADGRYQTVIILAGGNDIIRGFDREALASNVREMLTQASERGDQVVWLPAGDIGDLPAWPAPLAWWYHYRSGLAHEVFQREAAAADVTFIDIYRSGTERYFPSGAGYYAADGIHLTGRGYRVWTRQIRAVMNR